MCTCLRIFVLIISCECVKQLGYYNSFKQFSNFLVKGESVSTDAFSRETKLFLKKEKPFKGSLSFTSLRVTSSHINKPSLDL